MTHTLIHTELKPADTNVNTLYTQTDDSVSSRIHNITILNPKDSTVTGGGFEVWLDSTDTIDGTDDSLLIGSDTLPAGPSRVDLEIPQILQSGDGIGTIAVQSDATAGANTYTYVLNGEEFSE